MHPFEQLKNTIHADPDYAWGWHCNLAVPIMDEADVSHEKANKAAALIMEQMFGYDITTHELYRYEKSGMHAYFEARVAAERAEDAGK